MIAAIDELTEEALAAGETPGGYAVCPHCRLEWHGLPFLGCPGSGESVGTYPVCCGRADGHAHGGRGGDPVARGIRAIHNLAELTDALLRGFGEES